MISVYLHQEIWGCVWSGCFSVKNIIKKIKEKCHLLPDLPRFSSRLAYLGSLEFCANLRFLKCFAADIIPYVYNSH